MRYFQNNLTNDGWRQVSVMRAPQSIMVFQKANRMAVIALSEDSLNTYADLWVTPMNESFDGTPPKK
jgi:hypothetical protein